MEEGFAIIGKSVPKEATYNILIDESHAYAVVPTAVTSHITLKH